MRSVGKDLLAKAMKVAELKEELEARARGCHRQQGVAVAAAARVGRARASRGRRRGRRRVGAAHGESGMAWSARVGRGSRMKVGSF